MPGINEVPCLTNSSMMDVDFLPHHLTCRRQLYLPWMDVAACKRPPLLLFSSVDVTIPVEPEAAAALADARNREAVGRLVSRVLRPRAGPSPLAQAIAELKAEARTVGLSDADIDAELAAYNAERRDRSSG